MDIKDYIKQSFKNGLYMRYPWVIAAFCVTYETVDSYKKDPYKYRLIRSEKGYQFINEEGELEDITGFKSIGEPLLTVWDKITLTSSELKCVRKDITTSLGIALANAIIIDYPFNGTVEFRDGEMKLGELESMIAEKLESGKGDTDGINIDTLERYQESVSFIEQFSQVFTVSSTPKNILPPTGLEEFKKGLVIEYGDRLKNDKVALAEFEERLREFDRNYLGDDPSNGKFMSGKVRDKARSKLFLTMGQEAGLTDADDNNPIVESLYEGLPTDAATQSILLNASRSGSFLRGKKTQVAGVIVTTMTRATSNLSIKEGDCKTKNHSERFISETDAEKYLGSNFVSDGVPVLITKENLPNLINTKVKLRSTLYCEQPGSNYCRICAGENLSINPEGINLAISNVSRTVLSFLLSAVHGRSLETVEVDMKDLIS